MRVILTALPLRKPVLRLLALLVVLTANGTDAASDDPFPTSDLISDFESMCLHANAEFGAALAEADQRHWRVTPVAGWGPHVVAVRMSVRDHRIEALVLRDVLTRQSGQPTRLRTCEVYANKVDNPRALITYAEGLVNGVTPYRSDASMRQWFYAQTNQGARAIRSDAFAAEAVRLGTFRELMVVDGALSYTVGSAP